MTSDLGTVHTTRSLNTIEHLYSQVQRLTTERDAARRWAVRLEQEAHDAHQATRALIEDRERAERTIAALRYRVKAMREIEPWRDMAVGDVAQLNGD